MRGAGRNATVEESSIISILSAMPRSSHHPSSGSAFGRSTVSRKGRRARRRHLFVISVAAPPPRLRHSRAEPERSEGEDRGIHAGTPRQYGTAGEGRPSPAGGICRIRWPCPEGPALRSVSGNRTVSGIAGRAGCDAVVAVQSVGAAARNLPFRFPPHPSRWRLSEDWKRDLRAFCDWWATILLFVETLAKRDEMFADFMACEKGKFAGLAANTWRNRRRMCLHGPRGLTAEPSMWRGI